MLRVLRHGAPGFESGGQTPDWALPADAVWIELVSPTRAEEVAVEKSIGLLLPTREEMAEIEASSRLYQEDGGTFMTATVLVNADGDLPTAAPVTFVL
jgi:magnesium transporter